MTKKIAVIGGSGFLGSYVLRDLKDAGYTVSNLDNTRPAHAIEDWIEVDLRDLPQLTKALAGCDVVINLAAAHRDDVRPLSLYHDINVTGAENLCRAMTENAIKTCIFTSSVAVYGLNQDNPNEETPPRPFNPYGQTKWQAEQVYRVWAEQDSAHALLMVRPTVIFGPNNRGNVYNLIAQIARKRFIMVGNGRNKKSLAAVENVSHFIVTMLQRGIQPGVVVYNYADKPDWDVKTLVDLIQQRLGIAKTTLVLPYVLGYIAGGIFDVLARLTGRNFPISRVRIQKFCANTMFSADKLLATGFVPKKDLQTALFETIDHEFKDKNI